MMDPHAVSLHFRQHRGRPGVIVDSRTDTEYPQDSDETSILVYEDRVTGWFLRYGELLKEHHDAAFVVLQIALAQIEGIEQHRRGASSRSDTPGFFRTGLKRIFSLDDSADAWLDEFYGLVRCGLVHDGMTRQRVDIDNRYPSALECDGTWIRVSPNRFLDAVRRYFEQYIADLKDPANADLRDAFRRKWTGAV